MMQMNEDSTLILKNPVMLLIGMHSFCFIPLISELKLCYLSQNFAMEPMLMISLTVSS